jgi:uncharacterized protein YacL
MKKSSITKVLFSRLFGILLLLLVYIGVNYIARYFSNDTFLAFTGFFNDSILMLIFIGIIFMIGEIFETRNFPVNLPYPLFTAVGGVLVAVFVVNMLKFVNVYLGIDFIEQVLPYALLLYLMVFFIAIGLGYVKVFAKLSDEEEDEIKEKRKNVEWEDIGNEFKFALYNLGRTLNRKFSKKEKDKVSEKEYRGHSNKKIKAKK